MNMIIFLYLFVYVFEYCAGEEIECYSCMGISQRMFIDACSRGAASNPVEKCNGLCAKYIHYFTENEHNWIVRRFCIPEEQTCDSTLAGSLYVKYPTIDVYESEDRVEKIVCKFCNTTRCNNATLIKSTIFMNINILFFYLSRYV